MALCPFAKQQLIRKWNVYPMKHYRRMNVHVAVSEATSLYDMFSRSKNACSHFYVNKKGELFQYIDTKYQSAADLHGGDSTISVETAGATNPKTINTEKFTDAQFNTLVRLWVWARDTHKIPNQVAKDTSTTERSCGLSWHRLGIFGNFAGRKGLASISLSSIKSGGIVYSKSRGKECPGDAKINQIPDIFAAANKKEVKPTTSKPPVASKPKPESKPKPSTDKNKWPYKPVEVNGDVSADWDFAWNELMRREGYKGSSLTTKLQRWQKKLGYYKGIIEEDHGKKPVFGPMLVDAFQRFFRDKGLYKGVLDAYKVPYTKSRGSMLRIAEKKYLNEQAQYYK